MKSIDHSVATPPAVKVEAKDKPRKQPFHLSDEHVKTVQSMIAYTDNVALKKSLEKFLKDFK